LPPHARRDIIKPSSRPVIQPDALHFNRHYQLDTMTERLVCTVLQVKPRPYQAIIAA
jgi:hypothetical protein